MSDIKSVIEEAFERRAEITPSNVDGNVRDAVNEAIRLLDSGEARVAEQKGVGDWQVNEWLKKAVLLSFRINDNVVMDGGFTHYFDKVPSKYAGMNLPRVACAWCRRQAPVAAPTSPPVQC
jgi:2,3,4,5-tetrahydropyridine-2-carboxylate N-succinyltransferase